MKLFCILSILCFRSIPDEYHSYHNLYQYFILPDSIIWWEAGLCDLNSKNPNPFVKFTSDSSKLIHLPELTYQNTYSSNYHHSFLLRDFTFYLTRSGEIRFINKVEKLPSFIGSVNNLEEALFLANIYGYVSKSGGKSGSYRFKKDSYTLKLFKIVDPPDVVIIDQKRFKAKIKVHTNGDVFEIKRSKSRKLTVNDMYRTL